MASKFLYSPDVAASWSPPILILSDQVNFTCVLCKPVITLQTFISSSFFLSDHIVIAIFSYRRHITLDVCSALTSLDLLSHL